MSGIGQTVVDGIQEISAILPLLGTEQCETHSGSALSGGFCYVGITPISIFGSLGIVKTGFNILIASIVVPTLGFLGAKRLADGGFQPTGDVAPMVAMDRKCPDRFLAESQLEKLLEEEHIENIEDLTVEWAEGSLRWNIFMIAFTLFGAVLGIAPYLYLLLKPQNEHSLTLKGWPFPTARLLGSSLSAILIQVIIQIRVLILVKTRLVFIAVDRYSKENGNLVRKLVKDVNNNWSPLISSETCISVLKKSLSNAKNKESCTESYVTYVASPICAGVPPQDTLNYEWNTPTTGSMSVKFPEVSIPNLPTPKSSTFLVPRYRDEANHNINSLNEDQQGASKPDLKAFLNRELNKHFPSQSLIQRISDSRIYMLVLQILLGCGIVLSVAGYVGSFYLVQNAPSNSLGPVLWLVFEVLLCLLRIFVWSMNPGWDDAKGMAFNLKLVSHCPLTTCDLYGDEFESIGEAPVVRAKDFLYEIAAYTGPLPSFTWDDTSLYYILTGKKAPGFSGEQTREHKQKTLYVVIFDYKEQTSRLLVKHSDSKHFDIYFSSLKPDPRSTMVFVKTTFPSPSGAEQREEREDKTKEETHFLTSNAEFMDRLSNHYDDIIHRVAMRDLEKQESKAFQKTWALQTVNSVSSNFQSVYQTSEASHEYDMELVPSRFTLTDADKHYMEQGQLKRRLSTMYHRLEDWMLKYLKLFTKELFEDVPIVLASTDDKSVTLVQKYEVDEVECLITEVWKQMELLLCMTSASWKKAFRSKHHNMIQDVVDKLFANEGNTCASSQDNIEDTISKLRRRMKRRLTNEQEMSITQLVQSLEKSMHTRLASQLDEVQNRIQGRNYNQPKGKDIVNSWINLKDHIASFILKDDKIVLETNDWQEFEAEMNKRFENGRKELDKINEGDEEGRNLKSLSKLQFKKMVDRCRERMATLMNRLEKQSLEYKDAEIECFLTDPSEIWESKRNYWDTKAVRERIRFLNRKHKFLQITDETVKIFESFELLLAALERSQEFIVIDFSSVNPYYIEDYEEQIANFIRKVQSVTSFITYEPIESYTLIMDALDENYCHELISKGYSCRYEYVLVADHYRRDHPYLIFEYNEYSKCIVSFQITEVDDHIMTLRHCVTTSKGIVHIILNGIKLKQAWGMSQAVMENFQNEDILLPKEYLSTDTSEGSNMIEIVLAENSEGVYWLSDASPPVIKASP